MRFDYADGFTLRLRAFAESDTSRNRRSTIYFNVGEGRRGKAIEISDGETILLTFAPQFFGNLRGDYERCLAGTYTRRGKVLPLEACDVFSSYSYITGGGSKDEKNRGVMEIPHTTTRP